MNLDIIYLNKGLVYFKQNRLDKAQDYFKKVLTIDPKNSLAKFNLGSIYFKRKNIKMAFEYWRDAEEDGKFFHLIQRETEYLQIKMNAFSDWLSDAHFQGSASFLSVMSMKKSPSK